MKYKAKFPGFMSVYRDDNNKPHLYFFPGVTIYESFNKEYEYNDIDVSHMQNDISNIVKYDDSAIDVTFGDDTITRIHGNLVKTDNKTSINITMTV